jgi:hypothetical protein
MRDELDIPVPAMAPSYRPTARPREMMDPATKRLAIFAGLIGASLLGLVAVWGFTGHKHGDVPVIEADSRPVRVKPANPGGLQVPGAGESILSGEADGKQTLAPGPEAPAPMALQAQERATADGAAAPPPAPASVAAPAPMPADAAPARAEQPAPRPSVAARTQPDSGSSVRLLPGVKALAAGDPAPARSGIKPWLRSAPVPPAAVAAMPVAVAPLHALKDPQAITIPQPPAPLPAADMPPTPEPAAAAASQKTAVAGKRPMVQFAALDTGPAALAEWERLARLFPDLFADREPNITKTVRDGKTYWRIRTAGFSALGEAVAFCEKLKSRGGNCVPTL